MDRNSNNNNNNNNNNNSNNDNDNINHKDNGNNDNMEEDNFISSLPRPKTPTKHTTSILSLTKDVGGNNKNDSNGVENSVSGCGCKDCKDGDGICSFIENSSNDHSHSRDMESNGEILSLSSSSSVKQLPQKKHSKSKKKSSQLNNSNIKK